MNRAPFIAALAVAAFAVVAIWGALQIPTGIGVSVVDARAFPLVLAISLAVLALACVVQAARGRIPDEAANADEPLLPGAHVRLAWFAAAVLGTPPALAYVGFLAGGTIGFACVARAFGAKHWAVIVAASLAASFAVWLLFDRVLTLKLNLLMWPF